MKAKLTINDFEIPLDYKNNPILESIYLRSIKQDIENYTELINVYLLQKAKNLGLGEKYAIDLINSDKEFKEQCPSLIDYFKYKQAKEYIKAEKQAIENARCILPNAYKQMIKGDKNEN